MIFYRPSLFKRVQARKNTILNEEAKDSSEFHNDNKVCATCNQKIVIEKNAGNEHHIRTESVNADDLAIKLKPKISSYAKISQEQIMTLFK